MDLEAIKPKVAVLAEKYGLDFVVLFGSQATGKTHAKSDVDIAYFPSSKLFAEDNRLYVEMMEAVRKSKMDLVNLRQISPLLLKQIVDHSLVLYERRSGLFNEFVLYVFQVYHETAPLRRLEKDYVLRRTREYAQELSL